MQHNNNNVMMSFRVAPLRMNACSCNAGNCCDIQ